MTKDEQISHLTSLLVRAEEALKCVTSKWFHKLYGYSDLEYLNERAEETLTAIQSHLKGVE